MPVKLAPSGDIPFLINYTPPQIRDLTENIQDMISYNILPLQTPLNIEYPIGSSEVNQEAFRITFRNLTSNATLQVAQRQTRELLLFLENNILVDARTIRITLAPAETKELTILFNNETLNSSVQRNTLENLQLVVTYAQTGRLITRNNLPRLPITTI